MNRLIEGFQENFAPRLVRISENRFLVAVRNGVAVTMPLTIIGSLFLILANLPFPGWTEFVGEFGIKPGARQQFYIWDFGTGRLYRDRLLFGGFV